MTTRPTPQHDALRQRLVQLASHRDGMRPGDVLDVPEKLLRSLIQRLVDAGQLVRLRVAGGRSRLFAHPDLADAYNRRQQAHGRTPGPAAGRATRAPWSANAPIHYPTDAAGNPLYRHTVVPTPPSRYAVTLPSPTPERNSP